jgi:hypothetical protein
MVELMRQNCWSEAQRSPKSHVILRTSIGPEALWLAAFKHATIAALAREPHCLQSKAHAILIVPFISVPGVKAFALPMTFLVPASLGTPSPALLKKLTLDVSSEVNSLLSYFFRGCAVAKKGS